MHLQLVKDNNDWEIHKLELELQVQLAQLKNKHSTISPTSEAASSIKVSWGHKGSTEDIFIHSSGHMLRLQVRLNYMLIFLWQNFVCPTLLSFKVWVINLGSTTLYQPSRLPPSQFLSPHGSFQFDITPRFGLWSSAMMLHYISLHLHVQQVKLANTVQTSLMTSVKQRFKNNHMTHSVPLAPFSPPQVWIPLLKKNPHLLLLWRSQVYQFIPKT